MKIKLSKSQWEQIGRIAGWTKTSSLKYYAQNYTIELARTTKDPKILADILRRGKDDEVSWNAAYNPSTPPDALAEVLRRGNDDYVSWNAASNPSSSPFDVYKWYEATGKITKFDPTKHILDKPIEEPKEDPDLKRLEELALNIVNE